jgi:hypothetical protein
MKHKKFLTILLSLAIMVTFMPMMAFASTTTSGNVVWSDDFSSATLNGSTLEVRKTLGSDGVYEAKAYKNNAEVPSSAVYFFDLSKASMNLGTIYDNSVYVGMNGQSAELKFTDGSKSYTVRDFQGWTAKYKTDKDLKNTETVAAEVSVEWSRADEATALDRTSPKIIGTLAAKSVTVNPIASSVVNDSFYKFAADGKTKVAVSSVSEPYDGKEHELFIDDATGYSKELQKYNASTANWVKVDAVKYKDKAETAKYRAVFTQTAVNAPSHAKYVNVDITVSAYSTNTLNVKWTDGNTSGPGKKKYEVTAEQAANPRAFVEVTNKINNVSFDADEVTAVFDELFTVEVKKNTVDENQQTWTVVPKDKTDAGWTAALTATEKAHKTLFANYANLKAQLNTLKTRTLEATALVTGSDTPVVSDDKDDDITFSGVTTKSFKAKKKTKKLAKTKSFKITAVADSGNEIKFSATTPDSKIKVSADGKVTVKKGLKKGTYKFTVKAKTAAGNGYKAAKESITCTVKIK